MLDLGLMAALGFLGSFGHCAGMCGPLTVAFGLAQSPSQSGSPWKPLGFHLLLNFGRILSYALVGLGIGALGSLLMAGGQWAGVGSDLRRGVAILTGSALIWVGLLQINPKLLPPIPLINPMASRELHDRLSQTMLRLSHHAGWSTPLLLGMVWGLMPCGFLYAAQIKAAETGDLWLGLATMVAFGLGTLPTMLGVGVSVGLLSGDRRSQLFRMGGWVTITVGLLTLMRTGEGMGDATGHLALGLLMLALVARPLKSLWAAPLQYRRTIGVSAFVLALAHSVHMVEHVWGWNLDALAFMLPRHRQGIGAGAIALGLLTPAALTSFNKAQARLGRWWRRLHLLSVPALLCAAVHCILLGSPYLGSVSLTRWNYVYTAGLAIAVLMVLVVRQFPPKVRFSLFVPSQSHDLLDAPTTSAPPADPELRICDNPTRDRPSNSDR
jgi:sulfite exporter TauE/SafE